MISCILLPMLSGAVVARQRIAEEVVAVGEVLHRAAAPIKFRRPVVRLKARVVTRPLPDSAASDTARHPSHSQSSKPRR